MPEYALLLRGWRTRRDPRHRGVGTGSFAPTTRAEAVLCLRLLSPSAAHYLLIFAHILMLSEIIYRLCATIQILFNAAIAKCEISLAAKGDGGAAAGHGRAARHRAKARRAHDPAPANPNTVEMCCVDV
ncbi:hypothetical protein EVAR_3039_1 [Eumeta japonica]|uniref:Uncharacterized protein n=1 Tax=Eumeta variegata TaxID=151549 RepID=A0A4C1STT1_EUMVA|nr:hypothetical protein EVAR_3039_1 [Eumeta japonica]